MSDSLFFYEQRLAETNKSHRELNKSKQGGFDMRIELTGNPNSGKTTMYNALTGRNEKVGNWAGVTVEKKEGFKKLLMTRGRLTCIINMKLRLQTESDLTL